MKTIDFESGHRKEHPRSRGEIEKSQTPFTNYKKIVNISKIYGLTSNDLAMTKAKIKSQSDFLDFSYVQDNSTGQ